MSGEYSDAAAQARQNALIEHQNELLAIQEAGGESEALNDEESKVKRYHKQWKGVGAHQRKADQGNAV